MKLPLASLGRLAWALMGACVVLVAALTLWPEPISYPEVIVPAPRILEREVPGEVRWRDRIVYRYMTPDVRAVAPGAVTQDAVRFCRPVVLQLTEGSEPAPSLLRSVSWTPSLLPLARGKLVVTSMDGFGQLVAEDYSVRAPFGVAAGLEEPYRTIVRYPRWAPVREVATGLGWYIVLRGIEFVVR